MSSADLSILENVHPEPLIQPGEVAGRKNAVRWFITCLLALLLHVLLFAAVMVKLPVDPRFTPPPSIPVELVMMPPPAEEAPPEPEPEPEPEPQPEPEPEPEAAPEPEQQQPLMRQSGATDNPDLPAGEAPKVEQPEDLPEPAKPEETPQDVEKVEEPAPELPELPKSETGTEPDVPPQMMQAFGVPKLDLPKAFELPQPSRGFSSASSASGGGGDPYLNALRDKIIAHLDYPPGSEKRQGVARYQAIITRGGQLASVRLISSSGHKDLDTVGMSAIRRAAPFRRLPAGVPGDQAVIEISLRLGA